MLIEKFNNSNEGREPMSLEFIDIDDFKLISDTYGHLVGDEFLQDIAGFLRVI